MKLFFNDKVKIDELFIILGFFHLMLKGKVRIISLEWMVVIYILFASFNVVSNFRD
jgi:hypothetical protein